MKVENTWVKRFKERWVRKRKKMGELEDYTHTQSCIKILYVDFILHTVKQKISRVISYRASNSSPDSHGLK